MPETAKCVLNSMKVPDFAWVVAIGVLAGVRAEPVVRLIRSTAFAL